MGFRWAVGVIIPLRGYIPKGLVRDADVSQRDWSVKRMYPEGTGPRRGCIPEGLVHFMDVSRRDWSALRMYPKGRKIIRNL